MKKIEENPVDHGIRKVRHGKDHAVNLPATISPAEYYRVWQYPDGAIKLVPVPVISLTYP